MEVKIIDGQIEIKQSDNTYYKSAFITNFFIDPQNHMNFIEVLDSGSSEDKAKHRFISSLRELGANKFQGNYNGDGKIEFEKIPDLE